MKDFEYAAAGTIDEAVSLLAARGAEAKVLAGGTDLIVQLREGQRQAELVVDIKKIPDLTAVDYSPAKGLRLGAAVPCYRLYEDATLSAAYPALADSARIIGGWQIQSRASIGGNLCNSSPAADSIPTLLAYAATCQIAGPQGVRSVPAAQFCTGPGKNVLGRGEFLVCLVFPPPSPKSGAHYLRFIPRNEMDIAVVGCGAWVQLDAAGQKIQQARIALGAVAPTPVLASEASEYLAGKTIDEPVLSEAANLARRAAKPISDMRGTAEYRVHLAGVLARRALDQAIVRARA